ncbi:fatty acyl-CoA reductase 2-like [Neltuma alba]|uniref:fatty acyl-CoA reductase 2-like n=1 Tax=Neltuma alba TaxID=207710 RepID=UPI0010A3397D|nr:fatty acyl-CoA reductase 2-like [Prosopis alba]
MNPYLMRSLPSVSAPQNSSSSYKSRPAIPQSLLPCHYVSATGILNFEYRQKRIQKSRGVVWSQNNSESCGRNLSIITGVLEKPRESLVDEGNRKTTSFIMPSEIKPFQGGIGIVNFFKGKNFLITGATGFVAKVIVEKILRMVPETGKIFVLIKAKDKEEAMERLKAEIIECEVFKKIKEGHGENYVEFMMRKLIPVAGTVCEADLEMDANTANDIANQVHVVVNSAATTSFDERYDVALNTNTRGPFRLLNFAKKCKNLCLFFHISTAYVGDGERQGTIREKPLYIGQRRVRAITEQDIDFELKLASEMLDSLKQDQATQKMKDLGIQRANMYGWPNTYSFTKAMGEMLISSFRDGTPMVILRPTVIESSYSEPFPGWIQGYRVLDPLIFNYGKGHLPGFLGDPNAVIDVIPVDMVANATMAAIAKHGAATTPDLSIYHIGSSVANPISFGAVFDYARRHFKSFPLAQSSNGNQSLIQKMNFLNSLDDFSSYISMEMARQTGFLQATNLEPNLQKKSTKKAQLLIHLAKLYEPYMFYKAWFDCGNTQRLYGEMSAEEMKDFGFDVKSIDWEQYISKIHIPGYQRRIQIERLKKSCGVVCSQNISESYGGNLSTAAPQNPRASLEGFVAKVFVEKILRMVPETGKVFVLIKAKDKEAAMEKLKAEIIECEVFKKIKEGHGKSYVEFMMRKLIPVVGTV